MFQPLFGHNQSYYLCLGSKFVFLMWIHFLKWLCNMLYTKRFSLFRSFSSCTHRTRYARRCNFFIAFWALPYEIPDCADSLLRLFEGECCNIFSTSASLASVKMAGLPDLFLSETDPHSRSQLIILIIVKLLGTAESGYSLRNSPATHA
jgi:hypothetical protein